MIGSFSKAWISRSTAGTNEYAQVAPRLDKVGYDKEVPGKSHRSDGEELEVQALFDLRCYLAITLAGAFPGKMLQVSILVVVELGRYFKVRQQYFPFQLQRFYLIYDQLRIFDRLR